MHAHYFVLHVMLHIPAYSTPGAASCNLLTVIQPWWASANYTQLLHLLEAAIAA
jgi:hypothetical protein